MTKPYITSALMAGAAFLCSMVASYTCYFVRIKDSSTGTDIYYSNGIWYGEDPATRQCESYSGESVDTKWKSARAFAVLVTIFGSFAMLNLCCMAHAPPSAMRRAMYGVGSLCTWNVLWSGLTLLLLPSNACKGRQDASCSRDTGANLAIAGTVLWFVAGCMMAPRPDDMEALQAEENRKKAQEEVQQEKDEEGQQQGKDDEPQQEKDDEAQQE